MAELNIENTVVSPIPRVSPEGVLTFSFIPIPKSYVASSYPHPIQEAKAANPNETRDVVLSKSVPLSLFQRIGPSTDRENASENPTRTRSYTLKPGWFFMHITCWRPGPLDEEDEAYVPFDECRKALGLVYSWRDRPGDRWLDGTDPAQHPAIHPTLASYYKSLINGTDLSGNTSHFAVGESPKTFFIRLSDDSRNWHYRWHGLPEDCDQAIQSSLAASKLDKEGQPGACPRGLHHWTFGRPRAITLGQGGGWILYREEQSEVSWGGKNLPLRLRDALTTGKKRKLVINQAVLNPHHAREYVLAYNDGSVSYSFHESFQKDFDKIAKQWCGDRVQYQPHPDLLTDDDYPGIIVSDDSDSGPETPSQPAPPRENPRSDRLARHIRVPTRPTNGQQTPQSDGVAEGNGHIWGGQNQQPRPPAPVPNPAPGPTHPGYPQAYPSYLPFPYPQPQYGPPPGWPQPPFAPMAWGSYVGHPPLSATPLAPPPPSQLQQAPLVPQPPLLPQPPPPRQDQGAPQAQMPRPLFDAYTGKSIYAELGPQNHAEPDSSERSQSQTNQPIEAKDLDDEEEDRPKQDQPSSRGEISKQDKDKGFRFRKPWKKGG